MIEPEFTVLSGTPIAWRFTGSADGPVFVFLPGYKSDMSGSKPTALFDHCHARGQACLLLDYSGCGQSGGVFANGTLSRWRDEVCALVDVVCPGRELILVGSSMGGWLMLLIALELGQRVRGLVGIAAAPDFTHWGFNPSQKALLRTGAVLYEHSDYGPEPTPTYPGFWSDGNAQRVLRKDIPINCPVILLQGQMDPDVPWDMALKLGQRLRSSRVQTILIKDGDHRLSREEDIALLLRACDDVLAQTSHDSRVPVLQGTELIQA